MKESTAIALGVGALGVGALVWYLNRRKASDPCGGVRSLLDGVGAGKYSDLACGLLQSPLATLAGKTGARILAAPLGVLGSFTRTGSKCGVGAGELLNAAVADRAKLIACDPATLRKYGLTVVYDHRSEEDAR